MQEILQCVRGNRTLVDWNDIDSSAFTVNLITQATSVSLALDTVNIRRIEMRKDNTFCQSVGYGILQSTMTFGCRP